MTKQERIQRLNMIKDEAAKQGYKAHCWADEVLLYIRYIIHNVSKYPGYTYTRMADKSLIEHQWLEKAMEIYYQVRGNEQFVGTLASSIAAAICYESSYAKFGALGFTAKEIGNELNLTTQSVLRSRRLLKRADISYGFEWI